jgi:type IV secretory pathway TrbD component
VTEQGFSFSNRKLLPGGKRNFAVFSLVLYVLVIFGIDPPTIQNRVIGFFGVTLFLLFAYYLALRTLKSVKYSFNRDYVEFYKEYLTGTVNFRVPINEISSFHFEPVTLYGVDIGAMDLYLETKTAKDFFITLSAVIDSGARSRFEYVIPGLYPEEVSKIRLLFSELGLSSYG